MLPAAHDARFHGTPAMPKPYLLLLAMTLALSACSKSDSPATGNASGLRDNGLRPAVEPVQSAATVPAPAPELQRVAQKAASEAKANGNDKPRPNAAPDRAQRARAGTARRWDQFQAAIQRCVTVPVSAREHCLAEARDAYRSAHLDCAALPGRERKECVKYGKLWADTATDLRQPARTTKK
jgi:hypothetical protein